MKLNISYLLTLLLSANNAYSSESLSNLWMTTHGYHTDYLHGMAYLVPKSAAEVEKELARLLDSDSGFSKIEQQDIEYELSTTWLPLYFHFHPEAFDDLKRNRITTLAKVYRNGSITSEEKDRWSTFIEKETFSPDATESTMNNLNLKLNKIEWMKFIAGTEGLLRNQYYSREHIVLIDMTSILGKTDQQKTLIWYGGTKEVFKKTGFHLFAQLQGVTSFFSPGWDTKKIQESYNTFNTFKMIQTLSKQLNALPKSDVLSINRFINKRAENERVSSFIVPIKKSKSEITSNQFVSVFDVDSLKLNGEENQVSLLRKISNHFYVLMNNSNLYKLTYSNLKLIAKEMRLSSNKIIYSMIDENDRIRFLEKIQGNISPTYKNLYCWNEVLFQEKLINNSKKCFENILDPVVIESSDNQFYAYCASHMSDSNLTNRLINLQSRYEKKLTSLIDDRLALLEILPDHLQRISISTSAPLYLGDNLLWFGTYGGIWGLDTMSGTSSKSYNLLEVDFNNETPIGSVIGDWLSYPLQRDSGQFVHRVIQLSSGKIKFDIEGIQKGDITAHSSSSKWLAVLKKTSNGQDIIQIWNMISGDNFANFVIPNGYRLNSLEFTPNGNTLLAIIGDSSNAKIKLMEISKIHELSSMQ